MNPDRLPAFETEAGVAWPAVRSTTALKYAPDANPAGFQYAAEASSATATKAPPMPAARVPTASKVCAPAGAA